jgi:hypothetical protein
MCNFAKAVEKRRALAVEEGRLTWSNATGFWPLYTIHESEAAARAFVEELRAKGSPCRIVTPEDYRPC